MFSKSKVSLKPHTVKPGNSSSEKDIEEKMILLQSLTGKIMNKKLDAKSVERISKALGEPYRLKIMEEIRKEKDWLACEVIISRFDLAQSTISHHIKQLVDADLLLAEKEGRNTKYKVNKDVVSAYTNFINGFGE